MPTPLAVLITSWFDSVTEDDPSEDAISRSSSKQRGVRHHSSSRSSSKQRDVRHHPTSRGSSKQREAPPSAPPGARLQGTSTSADDFLATYAACDSPDPIKGGGVHSGDADGLAHDVSFLCDFHLNFVIADGTTTTTVRSGMHRADRRRVLLKTTASDVAGAGAAEAEFRLLRRFSHPNIVRALDLVRVADLGVLVLEFFDGMQLDCAVRAASPGWLSEPVARALCKDLMAGAQHLHEQGVVHGDLCPQRVLVSYDFQHAKILDLGAMARRDPKQHHRARPGQGSHRYAAPEVVLGAAPSARSDVWQVGLCLHLMLSGRLPQKRDQRPAAGKLGAMDAAQHVSIENLRGGSISVPCKSMLRMCLRVDARQRAALTELLRHPWLQAPREQQAPACPDDQSPLLLGLEQVGIDSVRSPMPWRPKLRTIDGVRAFPSEASEPGLGQDTGLPGQPSMKIVVVRPVAAVATIVMANHAEGTYKVRLPDGSKRTVRVEDTKVCTSGHSDETGSTTSSAGSPHH